MTKIIVIGTSHFKPEFNSIETLLKKKGYDCRNHAVSAIGIDTYFSRIIGILNKYKNEKLHFVIELPCDGRYHEFYRDENKFSYEKYDMWSTDFWPAYKDDVLLDGGKYTHYMAYYSRTQIFKAPEGVKQSWVDSLYKVKVMSDSQIESEEILAKSIMIDGYLKNMGHKVSWISVNADVPWDSDVLNENFCKMNWIVKKPLHHIFSERVGLDYKKVKVIKNHFPDGSHLEKSRMEMLINEFVVPHL